MKGPVFRINPELDPADLASRFAAEGRIHIPDFLEEEGAERLLDFLKSKADWRLVINQGDTLFELDRAQQAALTREAARDLDSAVYAAAQRGFQYRYETARVPDGKAERAKAGTLLTAFAAFLSGEALDFLRIVTGASDISFADAQATAYGPGSFLTAHDDGVAGKNRRAAYVYNLTRGWNPDWGGLLTFHDEGSSVAQSFVPAFNALNLFAVPQPHSVGFVTPFAARRRYSVTGWLRGGTPPP